MGRHRQREKIGKKKGRSQPSKRMTLLTKKLTARGLASRRGTEQLDQEDVHARYYERQGTKGAAPVSSVTIMC